MLVGAAATDADADFSTLGGASDVTDFGDMSGGVLDAADADVAAAAECSASDAACNTHGSIAEGAPNGGVQFGLRLLSLRSIVSFLAVGSWVCYTLCYALDAYLAIIIAVLCGVAAACGMVGAIIGMEKLQADGSVLPQNAVGKVGIVYLTVPAARSGQGKVHLLVQERYCEFDAVTDSEDPIPTGTEVRITSVNQSTMVVTKFKKPSIIIENTDK